MNIKMRQLIFDNAELCKEIENLRVDVDKKFQVVFETLDQLLTVDSKPKKIGYLKEDQAKYMYRRLASLRSFFPRPLL